MLAVTGANGHLGSRLLRQRALAGAPTRALVRSERAADHVRALDPAAADVRVVDYGDVQSLASALDGCTSVVHLVGVIREGPGGSYREAHEQSCAALVAAAGQCGLERVVYLSILGSDPGAANDCLASRGRAEQILGEAEIPAVVIRVPMVLGEDDYASRALAQRARRGWNVVLRASSLEQPIYAGDVITALASALGPHVAAGTLDLAGPESISRAALIRLAAGVLGRRTRVLSLPLSLGLAAAWLLETCSRHPPVTRAMLGVLDHDDAVDVTPAVTALGLTLTPLEETLRRCLGGPEGSP